MGRPRPRVEEMRFLRLQVGMLAGVFLAAACAPPEPDGNSAPAEPSANVSQRENMSEAAGAPLPPFELVGDSEAAGRARDAATQAAELRDLGAFQAQADALEAELDAMRGATAARAAELSGLVDEMNQMLGHPTSPSRGQPISTESSSLAEVRIGEVGTAGGAAREDWYSSERERLEGRIYELQGGLARQEQELVRYTAGVEAALAERQRLVAALAHAEAERRFAAHLERERNRPRLVLQCCTRMGQIPGAMEVEFTVTNYGGRTGHNVAVASMWVVEDPWVPGLPHFDPGQIPIDLEPGEQQIYSYRWPYVPDPLDGFSFRFGVHLEGPEWAE